MQQSLIHFINYRLPEHHTQVFRTYLGEIVAMSRRERVGIGEVSYREKDRVFRSKWVY